MSTTFLLCIGGILDGRTVEHDTDSATYTYEYESIPYVDWRGFQAGTSQSVRMQTKIAVYALDRLAFDDGEEILFLRYENISSYEAVKRLVEHYSASH